MIDWKKELFAEISKNFTKEINPAKTILEAIRQFETTNRVLSSEEEDFIIKYFYYVKFIRIISSETFDNWYNYKSKDNYTNFKNIENVNLQLDYIIEKFDKI